jgi:hypothetical protein
VGGITGGGARLPVTDSHGGRRRTLGLALELLTFLFRRVTCKVVFLGSFS